LSKWRAGKTEIKFGGGESEGGAGIPFPRSPFSFCPARVSIFCRALRGNQSEFFSKKVQASFSNCNHTKLSGF